MERVMKLYSVHLYADVVNEIRLQGNELAPYIRDLLDTQVDTLEKKEQRLKELIKQQEDLTVLIDNERRRKIKELERFEDLNSAKIEEIKEAITVIDKNSNYLEGRRNRYNNLFGETFDTKEFQKLLDKQRNKQK